MFFSRSCLAWLGTILQRDSVRDLGNWFGYNIRDRYVKRKKFETTLMLFLGA
jgi:hypothetical protein